MTSPFQIDNTTQIKEQIMKMQYFQLSINNIWILLKQENMVYSIRWDLVVHYDIQEQGHIAGRLEYIRNIGKPNVTQSHNITGHRIQSLQNSNIYHKLFEGRRSIYLQIIIFVLAWITLYSNLKFMFNTIDMYMQLRILKTFRN